MHCTPRIRARKGVFFLTATLALEAAICLPGRAQSNPEPTTKVSAAETNNGLSTLPANALGPISAALGKNDFSYLVCPSRSGFRAKNPRQRLAANFTEQGAELRSHNLRWALATRAYGYGDTLEPLKAVAPQAEANRVEYRRDGLTEWYENGPLGLEQGFTLARRPAKANAQPLTLELELSGNLSAALDQDGKALNLRDANGRTALRYTGLEARDATGRELRSWLEVRGEWLLVRVADADAQYPVVVDPWVQQAELTASDGAADSEFGYSVAISGTTLVVGAPYDEVGSNIAQGAAYLFVQSGSTWTQQAKLTVSNGKADDYFGYSVAISGAVAVVGAPGRTVGTNRKQGMAYVFMQSGTTWTQQAALASSDGAAKDSFGHSVAVASHTVVVGASLKTIGSNALQGAAYVFVPNAGEWSQQAELTASDGAENDQLGCSVSLSGSTILAGAPGKTVNSNTYQGAAYVFVQSGTTWSQQAELTASDGAKTDSLGGSVALKGTTAVVGAAFHTVGTHTQEGAAYVFVQSGATWSQQAELTSSDGESFDNFGVSVAVVNGAALVGASLHQVGSNAEQGAAYLFKQSGTTWSQEAELTSSDGQTGDSFGYSVALVGTTAVVGAFGENVGSNNFQGTVYLLVP
jgi:nucleoside-specific outer membrane channel protein Tsx